MPKIEPNMEQAMIVEWLKKENDLVKKNEPLFLIETAKAVIEVCAEESGMLRKILVHEGETVPILTVVAILGESNEPLPVITRPYYPKNQSKNKKQNQTSSLQKVYSKKIKASPAAKRLAREKKINIMEIEGTGPESRVVEEDVQRFINSGRKLRLLIIGAGNGGEVVADILSQNEKNKVIGFLDDNPDLWGRELLDCPILGGINMVDKLYREQQFDGLIISITTSMRIRQQLYEQLRSQNYKFVNAIHTQAYINPTAEIGEGNIIGAFVHIGPRTIIGNNNLITAHCSIEHHNHIGSHTLFGPGVMTSGDVTIDDQCSLGAGVNIEPHIKIGSNVAIASGTTVIFDIPSRTTIKSEKTVGKFIKDFSENSN